MLDSTQSSLNFEPSFVEIHQVFREIWLFEHEFQVRNFGQLRISFWGEGVKFVSKMFIELLKLHSHFRLKLKVEGKTGYFQQEIHSKISKQLARNKNRPIIVSFDGFSYPILATQAVRLLKSS